MTHPALALLDNFCAIPDGWRFRVQPTQADAAGLDQSLPLMSKGGQKTSVRAATQSDPQRPSSHLLSGGEPQPFKMSPGTNAKRLKITNPL
jgi:hypothetical protein